jgi:hypothetical protein
VGAGSGGVNPARLTTLTRSGRLPSEYRLARRPGFVQAPDRRRVRRGFTRSGSSLASRAMASIASTNHPTFPGLSFRGSIMSAPDTTNGK